MLQQLSIKQIFDIFDRVIVHFLDLIPQLVFTSLVNTVSLDK